LYYPAGIDISSSKDIYFADTGNYFSLSCLSCTHPLILGNNRIRKVTSTGYIFTVAGNGNDDYSGDGGAATSAALSCPYGVSVSSNNLYIADTNNNLIRYSFKHIILTGPLTYSIRRVTLSTGIIDTLIGSSSNYGFAGDGGQATSAVIFHPYGIELYSNDIYFADFHNNRIRKLSDTGAH